MSRGLINRTAVENLINGNAQIGSDFIPSLEREVQMMVEKALTRAHANGRNTLKERDI